MKFNSTNNTTRILAKFNPLTAYKCTNITDTTNQRNKKHTSKSYT